MCPLPFISPPPLSMGGEEWSFFGQTFSFLPPLMHSAGEGDRGGEGLHRNSADLRFHTTFGAWCVFCPDRLLQHPQRIHPPVRCRDLKMQMDAGRMSGRTDTRQGSPGLYPLTRVDEQAGIMGIGCAPPLFVR